MWSNCTRGEEVRQILTEALWIFSGTDVQRYNWNIVYYEDIFWSLCTVHDKLSVTFQTATI
jgi:hypothetical protein